MISASFIPTQCADGSYVTVGRSARTQQWLVIIDTALGTHYVPCLTRGSAIVRRAVYVRKHGGVQIAS